MNHPTSFPAITGKAAWESKLLTEAARWCTDKANGVVNFNGSSTPAFGVENQIWYYDGGQGYYRLAEITGDPEWRNCGDTIAKQFVANAIATQASSVFNRWFSDGPYRSMRNYDMRGRRAINYAYANLSGVLGSTFDFNIRETAYGLDTSMMKAVIGGAAKFHYINDATLKARIQRQADQLMGILWQYASDDPNEWMFNQSFMAGIGMRIAIRWYYYADDERVPILVKRLVDMMNTEMKGANAEFPNDIAWLRGAAVPGGTNGPKCGFNCFPYPSKELSGMFLPAWAWLWWMTGTESYRTDGDALFNAYKDYDISYSGKAFNEWGLYFGYAYIAWREGRMPAQFLPWQ